MLVTSLTPCPADESSPTVAATESNPSRGNERLSFPIVSCGSQQMPEGRISLILIQTRNLSLSLRCILFHVSSVYCLLGNILRYSCCRFPFSVSFPVIAFIHSLISTVMILARSDMITHTH